MFHLHDTVLYGTNGVFQITEISQKDFCGKPTPYFTLTPVYKNKSVIFVPMNNAMLKAKMRRMLTPGEIRDIVRAMPDAKPVWIENENERKVRYTEILNSGDRKELLRMLKAIHLHRKVQREKGRKLHACDERFFNEAETLLHEEFAHVLKIDCDQVLPLILKELDDEEPVESVESNG